MAADPSYPGPCCEIRRSGTTRPVRFCSVAIRGHYPCSQRVNHNFRLVQPSPGLPWRSALIAAITRPPASATKISSRAANDESPCRGWPAYGPSSVASCTTDRITAPASAGVLQRRYAMRHTTPTGSTSRFSSGWRGPTGRVAPGSSVSFPISTHLPRFSAPTIHGYRSPLPAGQRTLPSTRLKPGHGWGATSRILNSGVDGGTTAVSFAFPGTEFFSAPVRTKFHICNSFVRSVFQNSFRDRSMSIVGSATVSSRPRQAGPLMLGANLYFRSKRTRGAALTTAPARPSRAAEVAAFGLYGSGANGRTSRCKSGIPRSLVRHANRITSPTYKSVPSSGAQSDTVSRSPSAPGGLGDRCSCQSFS